MEFKKENQNRIFGREKIRVLNNINLRVQQGKCLGILGESGSGKTTLGRISMGLLKATEGQIFSNGKEIKSSSDRKALINQMSIVFQDYTSSVNPFFTVEETVKEGLLACEKKDCIKCDRKIEIEKLMGLVGLDINLLNRKPYELSGGQLQRVCIARALACKPEILLLDEAISSLDSHTQIQIMDLLKELKEKQGLTYIFITHDLTSITYICDEVVFLKDGEIVEKIDVNNLKNVNNHYAKELLNSTIDFSCRLSS